MSPVALALQGLLPYHSPSWHLWQEFLYDIMHGVASLCVAFLIAMSKHLAKAA